MKKYEVIISPKYTTGDDVTMTLKFDGDKFNIDTSTSTATLVSDNIYSIIIPKSTSNKFNTGIILEPKESGYTKDISITFDEAIINSFIKTNDTKYNYSSKLALNDFTITYNIGGVEYEKKTYSYNQTISPIIPEEKVGYTFSGWSPEEPKTMPLGDLTISGTYTINTYKVEYYVDDTYYSSVTYDYGSTVTSLEYTPDTGKAFSGWNGEPTTIEDTDYNVSGYTSWIDYTLTYVISGETSTSAQTYHYGDTISALTAETREGYTFEWIDLPTTMPNSSVTVTGVYTPVTLNLYYGSIYNNAIDTMTDDEIINKLSIIKDVKANVEYSFTMSSEVSEINADELNDADYKQWLKSHYYSEYLIIPSSLAINTYYEDGGNMTSDFKVYKIITINSIEYSIYRYTNDSFIVPSNQTINNSEIKLTLK